QPGPPPAPFSSPLRQPRGGAGIRVHLCSSVGWVFLLALQDVNDAHAAATHHVTEAGTRNLPRPLSLDLTRARPAPQLQCGLPDLRQAGRAAGMAARD